jgi:hypothetical protein
MAFVDNIGSAGCHFNISHYLHLGFCFCDVILDFWDPDQVTLPVLAMDVVMIMTTVVMAVCVVGNFL